MKENKYNIDSLTDELLDKESDYSSDDPFQTIIRRITVSPEITAMGEEMRESILCEVNSRIQTASRRTLWLKISTIAASVIILLGITNYISYKEGYKQLNSQFIEMNNPLGMQSSITLSDGTRVILNAGTTLKYPTAFVSKYREVEVDGEAFFEVTKDSEHPFIVKAEKINVRVLGTKFNIKAYKEEKTIDVTLEEGIVEIGLEDQWNYYQLEPGQQIRFDKSKLVFTKLQVDLNHYISWKEGKFYFNKKSFEDIAKQLERRFNVNIYIASDKLKDIVYTGDFIRHESLEQILKVMTADKRSKYKIDGDQVEIYE